MSGRLFTSLVVGVVVLAAAAVAGAAHGREAADIYTVHALVSDGGAIPAGATDASLVNALGPERRPDDTVVVGEQRHKHVNALQRHRREATAHRLSRGRADGDRLQRGRRSLRRQRER